MPTDDMLWKSSCCKYSRLSLSRIPRDSLKHFEISLPRNIRFAEVRKTINRTTKFNKWICSMTPEVRDILKILWKKGEIALLFSTIFCYLFLDFHVKTGTGISLRDKRLFEISEFEIARVNCTWFVHGLSYIFLDKVLLCSVLFCSFRHVWTTVLTKHMSIIKFGTCNHKLTVEISRWNKIEFSEC